MAKEEERIFSYVDDPETAKRMLVCVHRKLSLDELLERMSYSSHGTVLLAKLPQLVGMTPEALHPVMKLLQENYYDWRHASLEGFTDRYWEVVIRDRIQRGDTRRAWDEVKKAIFREDNFGIGSRLAETFAIEIYAAVEAREGVAPALPEETLTFARTKAIPAIGILRTLYRGFPEPDAFGKPMIRWGTTFPPKELSEGQRKIMALAGHFARKRNARRKKTD